MRQLLRVPRAAQAHELGAQGLLRQLQHDVAMASAAVSVDLDEAPATVAVSTRLTWTSKRFKSCAILISDWQDNPNSYIDDHNGTFTARLLMVWNRGAFAGNYATVHAKLKSSVPEVQTPNQYTLGRVDDGTETATVHRLTAP